jgi:hypothetical protein
MRCSASRLQMAIRARSQLSCASGRTAISAESAEITASNAVAASRLISTALCITAPSSLRTGQAVKLVAQGQRSGPKLPGPHTSRKSASQECVVWQGGMIVGHQLRMSMMAHWTTSWYAQIVLQPPPHHAHVTRSCAHDPLNCCQCQSAWGRMQNVCQPGLGIARLVGVTPMSMEWRFERCPVKQGHRIQLTTNACVSSTGKIAFDKL